MLWILGVAIVALVTVVLGTFQARRGRWHAKRGGRRGRIRQASSEARGWLDEDPLFLDTETTGLGDRDEVCEIAVVGSDGAVLLETLVRPTQTIPPEATAIHGIDDAAIASAPSFEQVKDPLQRLLSGRLVVAYNADFDARLLEQSARACGVTLAWPDACEPRFVCAMRLFARWNGEWDEGRRDWRFIRLGEAVALSGMAVPAQRHRAASDALLVRELVCLIAGTAAQGP